MGEIHKVCLAKIRAWKLMYDSMPRGVIVTPKQK